MWACREEAGVHEVPPVRADARAILDLAVPALGIAGGLLAALVSAFIFLAYGTTAAVARRVGAGDRAGALQQGIDGLWLAAVIGVVVALAGEVLAPEAVAAFHAPPDVAAHAVTYLRWSLPGVPGVLVVLAATGVLRGLLDTRTPLAVAAGGAPVNAPP